MNCNRTGIITPLTMTSCCLYWGVDHPPLTAHSPQLGVGHGRSPGQQQLGDGHAGAQADDEALCDGRRPPDPPTRLLHVLCLAPDPDPSHASHLPWAQYHWPRTLPVQQPWSRPDGWVQGEQGPLSWPWTTSSQETWSSWFTKSMIRRSTRSWPSSWRMSPSLWSVSVPVPEWPVGGVLLGQIRFPNCYSHHTSQEDIPVRSFVTAVSAWAEKWTMASCVNILSQDEAVVRNIGIKHSELWR